MVLCAGVRETTRLPAWLIDSLFYIETPLTKCPLDQRIEKRNNWFTQEWFASKLTKKQYQESFSDYLLGLLSAT